MGIIQFSLTLIIINVRDPVSKIVVFFIVCLCVVQILLLFGSFLVTKICNNAGVLLSF